jgi:hypothetical protein
VILLLPGSAKNVLRGVPHAYTMILACVYPVFHSSNSEREPQNVIPIAAMQLSMNLMRLVMMGTMTPWMAAMETVS